MGETPRSSNSRGVWARTGASARTLLLADQWTGVALCSRWRSVVLDLLAVAVEDAYDGGSIAAAAT